MRKKEAAKPASRHDGEDHRSGDAAENRNGDIRPGEDALIGQNWIPLTARRRIWRMTRKAPLGRPSTHWGFRRSQAKGQGGEVPKPRASFHYARARTIRASES
jgi:hypothetical protein